MSESCCCIDVDSYPEFYSEKIRTARKAHVCEECGATIEPGEQYEYISGMWEGGFDSHKTCWFCLAIRRDYFTCGWYFGQLREDFRECNGWDYVNGPNPDDRAEGSDPLFRQPTP